MEKSRKLLRDEREELRAQLAGMSEARRSTVSGSVPFSQQKWDKVHGRLQEVERLLAVS